MTIFIGADHRGFEFKNQLVEYLQEKNIRVEDMGPYEYDAQDDYIDFASKVAKAIQTNPEEYRGIVICGSGIGVSITANRYPGVLCMLGFNDHQVEHGRANDHVNCLSLPADYITLDQAKKFIEIFLQTPGKTEEKYLRRVKKVNTIS
ncbi:RpiB/LacA/LacB family sugar-phosphate isomerase [Candidatus Roizmanbacteria bacterium]|nr:RpiB/LacA/LacB family sugar-phosphate isomerase [Candidatus Roizmanbacteria bacterium]